MKIINASTEIMATTAEVVQMLTENPKWYAITDELPGFPFKNMRARNTGNSIAIVSHGATFRGLPIGDKWTIYRQDGSVFNPDRPRS